MCGCPLAFFWHHFHVYLTAGSTAVVCCYPQRNGVMTSLDLSSNNIRSTGAKHIAKAIQVSNSETAVVVVPVLC
jgi:hypothetical protein